MRPRLVAAAVAEARNRYLFALEAPGCNCSSRNNAPRACSSRCGLPVGTAEMKYSQGRDVQPFLTNAGLGQSVTEPSRSEGHRAPAVRLRSRVAGLTDHRWPAERRPCGKVGGCLMLRDLLRAGGGLKLLTEVEITASKMRRNVCNQQDLISQRRVPSICSCRTWRATGRAAELGSTISASCFRHRV